MDTKVYCLDPVEIVNPQLVGFILSSEKYGIMIPI